MGTERLDKLVAFAGKMSRSDARRLVKIGQVAVNGEVIRAFGFLVDPELDEISVQGERLHYEKFLYIMMNKPQGVISASEGQNYPTVTDLVPDSLKRSGLFPAGRLDKDTTGFVLITDDGAFAHNILSPKKHIEKTYEAFLDKPVTPETVKAFEEGICTKDGARFQSAGLVPLNEEGTKAQIVIHEGKYHQIKRMFAACGCQVLALRRTKMGKLGLDPSLEPGECRLITKEELNLITEKG